MTALDVRGVALRRGGRLLLDGLTFSAARGDLVALTGASGMGKTSILRAIGGLDPIAGGEVHVGDVVLTPGPLPGARRLRELHRTVGMVFQFHHLFAHMTALRNVCLAPVHVLKMPLVEAERQARELLDRLGVGSRAGAMPHELSGGEAQRVAIARALAVAPSVLLMDEPTASLDGARRLELAGTLRGLAALGTIVVVASHDAEFVDACADRVVALDRYAAVSRSAGG